jgi:transcriptional regulator with XRE-family HTH domain
MGCGMNRNTSLREWRLARGVTLKELAQKTGLRNSYLVQLEKGLRKGTPNTWIKIAQVLKISTKELFEEQVREDNLDVKYNFRI